MATLNGARPYSVPTNGINYAQNAIGKNSEVFTQYDIVKASTTSLLQKITNPSGANENPIGVIGKTVTMASTNQTVAKVAPLYFPLDQSIEWLMGTNSDLTGNATDVGTYYRITGGTNAQQVDVTNGVVTTTTRIAMITFVDPYQIGGTGSGSGVRNVVVKFVSMANFMMG